MAAAAPAPASPVAACSEATVGFTSSPAFVCHARPLRGPITPGWWRALATGARSRPLFPRLKSPPSWPWALIARPDTLASLRSSGAVPRLSFSGLRSLLASPRTSRGNCGPSSGAYSRRLWRGWRADHVKTAPGKSPSIAHNQRRARGVLVFCGGGFGSSPRCRTQSGMSAVNCKLPAIRPRGP